jgi:Family of unknown function (DUF6152)
MIKRTLVCVALCGLMATGSLLAHHSLAGVYDMKKDMELAGSVESVKFVNPHGVVDCRSEESRWLVNLMGFDTRLCHGPGAERDRQDRTECSPHRRRY